MKKLFRTLIYSFKLAPGLVAAELFRQISAATIPFISLYYTGKILDMLIIASSQAEIWDEALIFIILTACLSLIKYLATNLSNVFSFVANANLQRSIINKNLLLDYEQMEDIKYKTLLKQAEDGSNGSGGFTSFVISFFDGVVKNVLVIVYAFVLFAKAFTSIESTSTDRLFLFLNSPYSFLAVLGLLVLVLLLTILSMGEVNKFMYQFYLDNVKTNRNFAYSLSLVEDYKLAKDVRIYSLHNIIHSMIAKDNESVDNIYKKACVYERKINIKILLANAILLLASYLYVGAKAFYGIITVGSIITLVGAISSLSEAISSAIENIAQMILQVKYISNYFEYMDIKTGDEKEKKAIPSSGKGIISFNHVFFKYPNTDTYALKDVSFTIEPNKKMAIVGRNGAGKSTIIKLIARFYHPTDGQITLDGVDIEEYEFYSYQKLLGILFQDFSLFAFPLKENVSSLPSEITDNNRVEKSLDLVGFDYTDKNKLPKGLDNYIFHDLEDGAELSGGEQQKVAIARALYKDSPIILLDEPTSALDPKSELVVYNSIEKLVNNRTSLFISHRMSSTKFCDSIIVLDKGQIVQTGTHRSLLAQEGIYKKMFNEQAKYYR